MARPMLQTFRDTATRRLTAHSAARAANPSPAPASASAPFSMVSSYALTASLRAALRRQLLGPKLRLLLSSWSPASTRRFVTVLSVVLVINLVVSFPSSPVTPDGGHDDILLHGTRAGLSHAGAPSPNTRVSVWDVPSCSGAFITGPATHSALNIPYAMVRDVVVDRRPASHAALSTMTAANGSSTSASTRGGGGGGEVHRLLLYLSVHLSARLSRDASRVSVSLRNATLRDIPADVEYVMHTNHFLQRRRAYRPGDTTLFGREVTEWQVGVALRPAASAPRAMPAALAAGALLHVRLLLRRFDGVLIPFHVRLPLACALGWELPRAIARRGSRCGAGAGSGSGSGASRGSTASLFFQSASRASAADAPATGAVLLSGSALSGAQKRRHARHAAVAHFAARALLGAVRFDAVVIAVTADFSASDAQVRCGTHAPCRARLDAANRRLLAGVAADIEAELTRLGVPATLFERVVIVPSCRLGSDAVGSERGDACRISKRYGQYYVSFSSYAMVAPFFKWAASFEFDEFLWPSTGMKLQQRAAMDVLDEADASLQRPGHMVLQWLKFKLGAAASAQQGRALSQRVLDGRPPGTLRHVGNASLSERCYFRRADGTGKAAVRCDVGVGFTVHHAVLAPAGGRMLRFAQGNLQYRGLRTWHAKPPSKPGLCYLDV